METFLSFFRHKMSAAILSAFGEKIPADVSICPQEEFGHYQCNSALQLAKTLKMSPRVVAQKIIDHLEGREIFSKIEIAGPGFINCALSADYLSKELTKQLHDPFLGAPRPSHKKKIIVEFSSPNVAKELHVGHIRSTIIGDCLARLFEFLGQDVLRLNHIGDWGTQFGMLIAYMKEKKCKATDLEELMQWYRAAKKQFDDDADFKKRAQREVVRLQAEDPESMHAWRLICEISRRGFQKIYDLLGVKIIERGESFYNPYLKSVVEELEKKHLIELSGGAKCLFLDGFKNREGEPLPLMVQKSDGGYNYDTTDLAAIRYRIFTDKAERIIYVTDVGQSLHFQMIFAAAMKAGWLDPEKVQVDHVGFGLVVGLDGKKFKTRSGETERLIDLLTEAVDHARKLLIERSTDGSTAEIEHLAHVLGIGAVKYADLSCSRTKDYTFSYERMLRFEGNTAVFLLYSYVRIHGIQRKIGVDMAHILKQHAIHLQHPSEISLGLHLRRFGEVLDWMSVDLCPNRLTDYLYALAEKFNAFFRDCRVQGSPEEGERLVLCELTSRILRQGLNILGLETVEKM